MMCEECDAAVEPLRDAYLALRARKARTWTPRRRVGRAPAATASAQSAATDTAHDDVRKSAYVRESADVGKNAKVE